METTSEEQESANWMTFAYRATIVALAVIVIGIYFIRTPLLAMIGSAELKIEIEDETPTEFDSYPLLEDLVNQATEDTLSDKSIYPILDKWPELYSSLEAPGEHNLEKTLELLRHRIQIQPTPLENSWEVVVSASADQGPVVVDICDQISSKFQKNLQANLVNTSQKLNQSLVQESGTILSDTTSAKYQLSTFIDQNNDLLDDESVSEAETTVAEAASANPDSSEKQINPRWIELNDELKELKTELEDTTVKLTEQHPLTLNFQARVDKKSSQLASIPKYIGEEKPEVTLPQNSLRSAEKELSERLSIEKQKANAIAQLHLLQKAVLKAEQNEKVFNAKRDQVAKLHAYYQSIHVNLEKDAHISSTLGGLFHWHHLFMLILFAGILGSLAAYYYPTSDTNIFVNFDQLGEVIQVPLMGAIPATTGPHVPRPSPWRDQIAQWTSRISEYVLVGTAVLLIFSIVFDQNFTTNFLESPFSSLQNIQENLFGFLY